MQGQEEVQEPTVEDGYRRAVGYIRDIVADIKIKLDEGVEPTEVADRIARGMSQDRLAIMAAPGLFAVAAVLLTQGDLL